MNTIQDWDEYYMRMVYLCAQKSKDPRTKVGAVLVKDNHVVATAYNGFPRLVKDLPERYNNRSIKLRMINHSEEGLIINSARLGINTNNGIVYSQGQPCSSCARILIQGGIKEFIYHKQWPNLTHSEDWIFSIELSKMMFEEAGLKIRELDKVLNLQGFLDGKIINV